MLVSGPPPFGQESKKKLKNDHLRYPNPWGKMGRGRGKLFGLMMTIVAATAAVGCISRRRCLVTVVVAKPQELGQHSSRFAHAKREVRRTSRSARAREARESSRSKPSFPARQPGFPYRKPSCPLIKRCFLNRKPGFPAGKTRGWG